MFCNIKPGTTSPCMKVNCQEQVWQDASGEAKYDRINLEYKEGKQSFTIELLENSYTDFKIESNNEGEPLDKCVNVIKHGSPFLTAIEIIVSEQPPANKTIDGDGYYVFNIDFLDKNNKPHDPTISVGPTIPQ